MKDRVLSKKSVASSTIKLPKIEKQRVKDDKDAHKKVKELMAKKDKQSKKVENKISFKGQQEGVEEGNNITAQAYAIYDQNFNLIANLQGQTRREVASLTKLMTLYTAYKIVQKFNTNIKTVYFRVSANAGNIIGTTAELDPKEWVTVEDLFYAMMLPSGNDAALVLCQNFGAFLYYQKKGEVKALNELKSLDITDDGQLMKHYAELFIRSMNQNSFELGLKDTFFTNPHGLDSKEAYSTAKDMCILMNKILLLPQLLKVIGTRQYFARLKFSIGKKSTNYRETDWMNTNRLLWKRGYIGGKTGQTISAGNCLTNIYEKEGKKYLIVVLGCNGRENRFSDTQKLVQKYLAF